MRLQVPVLKLVVLTLMTAFAVWGCCETDTTILNIGPGAFTGLKCPDGVTDVALGCNGSPNAVPTSSLDVYIDSGNVYTNLNVMYLIIGIPLANGQSAPASVAQIDTVKAYNPYPSDASPSIWTANVSGSYCGSLTSGETNAYYECLKPTNPNSGGNSFAAWYAAAQEIGLNPTSFALYYYNISGDENLVGHGLYSIQMAGNLPVGTMEIAYGCATGECSNYCYVTPVGQAGQVTPEPSSLLLVGGAAFAFVLARFRRKKS